MKVVEYDKVISWLKDFGFDVNTIHIFEEEVSENMHEMTEKEHTEENLDMLNKMLNSYNPIMAESVKAEIEEKQYWRKLRGDIALILLQKDCKCGEIRSLADSLVQYLRSDDHNMDVKGSCAGWTRKRRSWR